MEALRSVDHAILQGATRLGGEGVPRDTAVFILAEILPYLAVLTGILIFLKGRTPARMRRNQEVIIVALVATLLAFGVRVLLAGVLERPRPYVSFTDIHYLELVSQGHNYLSFPSSHAVLLFAFAGAVYFQRHHPRTAIFLLVLATLTIVARVMAGVHYPIDVAGGALLGLAVARVVTWQRDWIGKQLD